MEVTTLFGRRVMLRPLVVSDFPAWREVRLRCGEWLTRWEPQRIAGQPDPSRDRDAFAVRCSARQRERQLGTGYGFGIFAGGDFCGALRGKPPIFPRMTFSGSATQARVTKS